MSLENTKVADSTMSSLIDTRDLLHQELQAQENNKELAELHKTIDKAIKQLNEYSTSDLRTEE